MANADPDTLKHAYKLAAATIHIANSMLGNWAWSNKDWKAARQARAQGGRLLMVAYSDNCSDAALEAALDKFEGPLADFQERFA